MRVNITQENGTEMEEITEFHVHTVAPGPDPYPEWNGTNPFPHPQISAVYDTVQFTRDPDDCIPTNDTGGGHCRTSSYVWEHQVLEIRFLRLLEFGDSDADGGYTPGEPILSQLDLADPAFLYAAVALDGQNLTLGPQTLPVRTHYPDGCCGESWEGWLSEDDATFSNFDGLTFRMSATGSANVTIVGYQWFRPRTFQGVNLTPFQAKLDMTYADYPFVDPDSRLALELNFTAFSQGSSTNWDVMPWPEGHAIGADSTNTTAIFAWASNATADGVETPVAGTVVDVDPLSRRVFLSYPQADLIQHDPVLGVTDKRIGAMPDRVVPPSSSL